ncbi:hypothetical protein BJV74DRAFT_883196 [Russula compacta]|nr:hypothetical protein BJV74DRAFT_883196 [Russula compacta]
MRLAFRAASCITRRYPPLPHIGPVTPLAISPSRGKRVCSRPSSTVSKSAAKKKVKIGVNSPENNWSFIRPLPILPPPQKGTPLTITTRDIEEYIQPLYLRGWGLSPILPNGNGIAVLRKRFELASVEALEEFLADLGEYEEKKQHHAKTNVFEDQHAVLVSTWTHVARRSNAGAEDQDANIQGVTVRDIRLAYVLEELFENALVASGREYHPHVRPEADRPNTVEELEGCY